MGFLPSLPWTLKVEALSLGVLSAHSSHLSTGEMRRAGIVKLGKRG